MSPAVTNLTLRLTLPDNTGTFTRADLVFLGVEHAGPSVEVRVFLNAADVDENTPTTTDSGYAGHFSIFGHGGCYGDEGHCDIPERRPYDLRPIHPLTPITKHVTVTDAVRRLLAAGTKDLEITVVPVLHDVPAYVPSELLDEPLRFERLSIVFYA